MKDFLKVFLAAFLVFAIVGFITGWDDRRETTAKKIYRELEVSEINGRYYFVFKSEGNLIYHYSIDGDSINVEMESIATSLRYHENSFGKASERNNEIVSAIGNYIGPTAGVGISVYSAVDFIKKPKAWAWSNIKKNVSMLLGGVSGFFLGKHIGATIWTDPDSDLALEMLNDDMAMWRNFERERLVATLIELQTTKDAVIFGTSNISLIGDDPIQLCKCSFSKELEKALQRYLKKTRDYTSDDFRLVHGFQTKLKQAQGLDTYTTINKLSSAHALSKVSSGKELGSLKAGLGYSEEAWNTKCAELCATLDAPVKIGILNPFDKTSN